MTDQAIPAPGAGRSQIHYLIAGETRVEFDGAALRDRIRRGELQRDQQISIVGTDQWKRATEYPALERYFALIDSAGARSLPASASAGPIGGRIVRGVAYPFTSLTAIVFIGLAGLTAPVPLLPALVGLVGGVYSLAIIRKSSEGETRAPVITETGGAAEWIFGLLRLVAITVISAWPVIAVMLLMFVGMRSFALIPVAIIVMLLYYPACLASIAIWKRVSIALSVSRIFAFITSIGRDYFIAVGIAILAFLLITGGTLLLGTVLALPLVVAAINQIGTMWAVFYASHLLGWAVCRNRESLGLS